MTWPNKYQICYCLFTSGNRIVMGRLYTESLKETAIWKVVLVCLFLPQHFLLPLLSVLSFHASWVYWALYGPQAALVRNAISLNWTHLLLSLICTGTNDESKKDEDSSESEEEAEAKTPKTKKVTKTPQTFPKVKPKVRATAVGSVCSVVWWPRTHMAQWTNTSWVKGWSF